MVDEIEDVDSEAHSAKHGEEQIQRSLITTKMRRMEDVRSEKCRHNKRSSTPILFRNRQRRNTRDERSSFPSHQSQRERDPKPMMREVANDDRLLHDRQRTDSQPKHPKTERHPPDASDATTVNTRRAGREHDDELAEEDEGSGDDGGERGS